MCVCVCVCVSRLEKLVTFVTQLIGRRARADLLVHTLLTECNGEDQLVMAPNKLAYHSTVQAPSWARSSEYKYVSGDFDRSIGESMVRSFVRSFIHSFIRLFVRSFVRSSVSFMFVHSIDDARSLNVLRWLLPTGSLSVLGVSHYSCCCLLSSLVSFSVCVCVCVGTIILLLSLACIHGPLASGSIVVD